MLTLDASSVNENTVLQPGYVMLYSNSSSLVSG